MTDDEGDDLLGKEIVDVDYNGDYYTPFTVTLEDGTDLLVGGWRDE